MWASSGGSRGLISASAVRDVNFELLSSQVERASVDVRVPVLGVRGDRVGARMG